MSSSPEQEMVFRRVETKTFEIKTVKEHYKEAVDFRKKKRGASKKKVGK
jgi:hypothetical protein